MTDNYYVITNNDGTVTITRLLKKDLLRRLREKYYGEDVQFLSKTKTGLTGNMRSCVIPFMNDGILIIKGDIVLPTEITTVTGYDIN